jgi:TonB-linked SusC/RagA family outer membrane protein
MNVRRLVLSVLGAALLAMPAAAQNTGNITGRVQDAATLQPLAGAQVVIDGLNIGALANSEGRFLLTNVPTGTHTLRAVVIGYGAATQQVTVSAGQTAVVDFSLSETAIALDALVVTALGEQRKVELGNAVGTIAASEVVQVAPITNIADLLQGRTAGVQIANASGTTGMGSRIRIRGANSISLSNEPLIYVDGVRVNNSQSFTLYSGGQEPSRLNDFNPEDIESIEIVKGPAAATLYGTEAANGVIRITTKRGRAGEARWNFWAESGLIQEPNTYPLNFAGLSNDAGFEDFCLLDFEERGFCTQTGLSSYQILNDEANSPKEDGYRNQFGASVSGGTDRVDYYLSAEWEGQTGPWKLPDVDREKLEDRGVPIGRNQVRPESLERVSLRSNVNAQISENADVGVRLGFVSSDLSLMGNDNNSFGFLPSAFFGGAFEDDPDSWWGFQSPAELFGREFTQAVERFTASTTANYSPLDWLDTRASVGLDYSAQEDISFFARDIGVPGQSNLGRKDRNFRNRYQYTFDANATATFDLSESVFDGLISKTSVGTQYFRNVTRGTDSWGIDIVNGGSSIAIAAETFSNEVNFESKTAGVFVEQQFSFNDRLFLTGAVRADDNSAFGQDFDLIYYPKASLSYVISEEDFFPEVGFLDQLRFRVAWGKSGLQPGATAAIQTLAANPIVDPGDNVISGVSIGEVGNNLLEPEESSELEMGFDADLFGGRAGIEFTYYDKKSDGTLIQAPLAPSLGASASRWVNIGETSNKGIEALLSTAIVDTDNWTWDVTLSGSINENELVSLGDNDPIGTTERFVPGYPLGGYWAEPILDYGDANGDGIIGRDEISMGDTLEFIGSSFPSRSVRRPWAPR